MSQDLIPMVFLAAMITLGGLYLVLRDEPIPDEKASKKIIVSNVR
jgi:hypothetical protein